MKNCLSKHFGNSALIFSFAKQIEKSPGGGIGRRAGPA